MPLGGRDMPTSIDVNLFCQIAGVHFFMFC
jgi:hypothetical protein